MLEKIGELVEEINNMERVGYRDLSSIRFRYDIKEKLIHWFEGLNKVKSELKS